MVSQPIAIQADFVDTRRVRTRKVLELRFEVPLEHEPLVHQVLGYPDPASGVPVGIALLNENAPGAKPEASSGGSGPHEPNLHEHSTTPDRPRKRWSELSRAQQAGIRCGDEKFRQWFAGDAWVDFDAEEAAASVRETCGVSSRADLDTDPDAAARWDALDTEFQAWAGYLPEERG